MDDPFMRYLIGVFVVLVSIGLVMEVRDTSQATAETANTQAQSTQGISSEDHVQATCDYEANTAACAYKAAIDRCGRTILDASPVTNDAEQNDAVVTRYNNCVEPYRQAVQRSSGDLEPSGR
jgi:hypothetical protein